jgi:hypothetical protein
MADLEKQNGGSGRTKWRNLKNKMADFEEQNFEFVNY